MSSSNFSQSESCSMSVSGSCHDACSSHWYDIAGELFACLDSFMLKRSLLRLLQLYRVVCQGGDGIVSMSATMLSCGGEACLGLSATNDRNLQVNDADICSIDRAILFVVVTWQTVRLLPFGCCGALDEYDVLSEKCYSAVISTLERKADIDELEVLVNSFCFVSIGEVVGEDFYGMSSKL